MKNLKLAIICLGFTVAATVATETEAGRIKMPPKGSRTEKTEEMMKPARYDNFPAMQFMSGVLTRDGRSGWKVGETPLYLSRDCVITMVGAEEGWLEEGRKAVVMGARFGEAISALTINVYRPGYSVETKPRVEGSRKQGPNPNVGELTQRPE